VTIANASPIKRIERRGRWGWAEVSIWKNHMLATLENGVKRGVWFSLIDKVYNPRQPLVRVVSRRGEQGLGRRG
jgi:hypothetical protein